MTDSSERLVTLDIFDLDGSQRNLELASRIKQINDRLIDEDLPVFINEKDGKYWFDVRFL